MAISQGQIKVISRFSFVVAVTIVLGAFTSVLDNNNPDYFFPTLAVAFIFLGVGMYFRKYEFKSPMQKWAEIIADLKDSDNRFKEPFMKLLRSAVSNKADLDEIKINISDRDNIYWSLGYTEGVISAYQWILKASKPDNDAYAEVARILIDALEKYKDASEKRRQDINSK